MLWLLDTNIASHAIRGDVDVLQQLTALPVHSVKMSAVTQAELLYGVAKRGHPAKLAALVHAFIQRVEPLPWTPRVAACYGGLRAACEAQGTPLAPLDMMIAAHALALGQTASVTLVTRDGAFARVPAAQGLVVASWR